MGVEGSQGLKNSIKRNFKKVDENVGWGWVLGAWVPNTWILGALKVFGFCLYFSSLTCFNAIVLFTLVHHLQKNSCLLFWRQKTRVLFFVVNNKKPQCLMSDCKAFRLKNFPAAVGFGISTRGIHLG